MREKAKEKERERKTTLPKSAKSSAPKIDAREEIAAVAHVSHDTIANAYVDRWRRFHHQTD